MKKTIVLLALSVCLFSCKEKKEDILARKWHGIALVNPELEMMVKQQQVFIDTVGTHTDNAANVELYGITNIDSLKKELQGQLDSFKVMQLAAVKNTEFNFSKDSLAVINFGVGVIDSCKWYFDEDGALILDEMKLKGSGDKIRMEVLQLADTVLKLSFNENGTKSTITFKPGSK